MFTESECMCSLLVAGSCQLRTRKSYPSPSQVHPMCMKFSVDTSILMKEGQFILLLFKQIVNWFKSNCVSTYSDNDRLFSTIGRGKNKKSRKLRSTCHSDNLPSKEGYVEQLTKWHPRWHGACSYGICPRYSCIMTKKAGPIVDAICNDNCLNA